MFLKVGENENGQFIDVSVKSKGKKELLSVTVVKEHHLSEDELIERVVNDLAKYCKIKDVIFLKHYYIKKALFSLWVMRFTQ